MSRPSSSSSRAQPSTEFARLRDELTLPGALEVPGTPVSSMAMSGPSQIKVEVKNQQASMPSPGGRNNKQLESKVEDQSETPIPLDSIFRKDDDDMSWLQFAESNKFDAKSAQSRDAIVNRLEHQIELDRVITRCNIDDSKDIVSQVVAIANMGEDPLGSPGVIGTVVGPGQVGPIEYNGQYRLVGEGRYWFLNPRKNMRDPSSINVASWSFGTITVFRVPKGCYGLAIDGGKYKILGEGLHVHNNRFFKLVLPSVNEQKEQKQVNANGNNNINIPKECVLMDQPYINNGTIHIIRVPEGQYAKVTENNIPKLLLPGMYVVDHNYFSFDGFESINQEYLSYKTIHVVRCAKDKIAKVTINTRPVLLYAGEYVFRTGVFKWDKPADVTDTYIKYGTITRLILNKGLIAICVYDSKVYFLEEPRTYEVDDRRFMVFKWTDDVFFAPASEQQIKFRSRMRLMVLAGQVGALYDNGQLRILQPGISRFNDNGVTFRGFIPTTLQALQLGDDSKEPYQRCETADFVQVGVKANVFFAIEDVARALTRLGTFEDIKKAVKENAEATMQAIVRNYPLNQVAQNRTVSISQEKKQKMFFDDVHDRATEALHETFSTEYGVKIVNVRIDDFKIMNQTLAGNISEQAINTAKNENKRAQLVNEQAIAEAEQIRKSLVIRTEAEAAALKLQTETKARNEARLADARAEKEAIQIKAEAEAGAATARLKADADAKAFGIAAVARAEAEAIILKAQAEKKAREMYAEAENVRNQKLKESEIGQKLALRELETKCISASMQGVKQVAYLSPEQFPLNMFCADRVFRSDQSKDEKRNI